MDKKESLTQVSIKSCHEIFNILNTTAIIVTPELELLWVNTGKVTTDNAGNKPKCYAQLFDRQAPCDGCPFKKQGLNPGEIVFQSRILSVLAFPLSGSDNFFVLHQDITRVASKKYLMETILNKLPSGIIYLDNDCVVKYASPAFFHLFPFIKRPITGKDFRLVISKNMPPFPKSLLDFAFKTSKNTGDKALSLDFRIFKKDPVYLNISSLPVNFSECEKSNSERGCLFIFSDQTETSFQWRRREQEAVQVSLEKVLHEIHQNLYKKLLNIKNDIDLLGLHQEVKDDNKFEEVSGEIRNILNYLDVLSSYGRTKKKITSEINLNKLLLELVSNHKPEIRKKRIKIKVDLTRHMRPINANYEKLYKASELLLLNAIESVSQKNTNNNEKYMPLIEIQTRMQETTIEMILKDNGAGAGYLLPAQGRVNGMDLSLSQLTIQSLGGIFSLRNIPNVGSKIVIKIPSAPALSDSVRNDSRTRRGEKEKKALPVFRNRTFWILGEEDYAAEIVQNLLSRNGATFQNIKNLKVVGNLLEKKALPDAFIINISLEKDIPAFIVPLKRAGLLGKCLFLTPAEHLATMKKMEKSYGITHIISKPFPVESLLESLTALSARKQ